MLCCFRCVFFWDRPFQQPSNSISYVSKSPGNHQAPHCTGSHGGNHQACLFRPKDQNLYCRALEPLCSGLGTTPEGGLSSLLAAATCFAAFVATCLHGSECALCRGRRAPKWSWNLNVTVMLFNSDRISTFQSWLVTQLWISEVGVVLDRFHLTQAKKTFYSLKSLKQYPSYHG